MRTIILGNPSLLRLVNYCRLYQCRRFKTLESTSVFIIFEIHLSSAQEDFLFLHGGEGKSLSTLGEWTSSPMSPLLATFPVGFPVDFLRKQQKKLQMTIMLSQGTWQSVINTNRLPSNPNAVMWPMAMRYGVDDASPGMLTQLPKLNIRKNILMPNPIQELFACNG